MDEITCFEIIDLTPSGITLRNENANIFISFDECAKNYASDHGLETSRCVAERDITRLMFIFYSVPRVKLVFQKRFFKDLFSGQSATNSFLNLQKTIRKYGYTSYDLS